QSVRNNLQAFLTAGGNVAIFSGNTCYRPVNFDPAHTFMNLLAHNWIDMPAPAGGGTRNESSLIGVTFAKGAAQWGNNVGRPPSGYMRQEQGSWTWVFDNISPGSLTQPFGQGTTSDNGSNGDHLVGYECDGIWTNPSSSELPGYTPADYVVLATGECMNS